jgi:phosphohistidine phosphatase
LAIRGSTDGQGVDDGVEAVRVVYLLRHAKSSWKEPIQLDSDRPLAPRGRRAARAMADHLRREGLQPSLILCSPARRTRETLELVSGALPGVAARVEDELYGAGEKDLLARLRKLPGTVTSVLLIGHNPGLHDLAVALAGSGDREALARLRNKMPTGALVTLQAPAARWRDLRPGEAELVAFVVPRELG